MRLQHVADALAEALAGPAQVDFEHLADVHPRRHAQRVQHDVAGVPSAMYGMSSTGTILRHHALVAVAAGHLVARLQAALDGQVDLDHLLHARRQLVALRELLALLFERQVELWRVCVERVLDRLELRRRRRRRPGGCRTSGNLLDDRRGTSLSIFAPLASFFGPPLAILPISSFSIRVERVVLDDAQLVVQVQAVALELVVDDLLGALVALDAFAGEHLHVDHGARRCPDGTRSDVSFTSDAFSPKIARSSFSSGVSWVSPFGVTLPTSTSPGFDFGADVDDARLVEARQLRFATGSRCRA